MGPRGDIDNARSMKYGVIVDKVSKVLKALASRKKLMSGPCMVLLHSTSMTGPTMTRYSIDANQ